MGLERRVRRYAAYFFRWCQAFGEHEMERSDAEVRWLITDQQVGLILAPHLRKDLNRLLLTRDQSEQSLVLSPTRVQVGEVRQPLREELDRRGLEGLRELLRAAGDVHLFLTYHLCYPPGTRIVTFSLRPPLALMYKEVSPLRLRID